MQTEMFMRESGLKTRHMVMEFILILMEQNMKVIGRRINRTVME
jgi:hypothetical protein